MELKICAIAAGIKKKMKHHEIILFEKSKLKSRELLVSKPLIDSVLVMMNLF